jgi:hypothetical protein
MIVGIVIDLDSIIIFDELRLVQFDVNVDFFNNFLVVCMSKPFLFSSALE